jgi:hypothetical protein
MWACKRDHFKIVKLFLEEHNANPNPVDTDGINISYFKIFRNFELYRICFININFYPI